MQGGGLREESVGLLSIIEPLHMLKDGGWDSARGPSKHFQACYYFILGSQALVINFDCSTGAASLHRHLQHNSGAV